jgi:hypothetical protein
MELVLVGSWAVWMESETVAMTVDSKGHSWVYKKAVG